MTFAIGPNPIPALRIGPQDSLTTGNWVASGALTLALVVGGGGEGSGVRRLAEGAISLRGFVIQDIPVQPVIRRGAGNVALTPEILGSTAQIGHPGGTGSVPIKLSVVGQATRIVDTTAYYDAAGDVPIPLVVAGDAFISSHYITGAGAISLGSLVLADVSPGGVSTEILQLDGFLLDVELEGIDLDPIELEGMG